MKKYAKLECNESEYNMIQSTQFQNDNYVTEQFIGSRKKLYANKKMIATVSLYNSLELGGITKSQFNSFLGSFNKQLYKRFLESPELYSSKIEFKGVSREKNYSEWERLNDQEFFYNVDLRSAYWQVAYKLGYLSDKMFKTYASSDEYKMAKRVCISFLSRRNYMIYHSKNNDSQKIECDTSVLKQVYENIRHYLYNTMLNCVRQEIKWIEYNIDGVTIPSEYLFQVTSYLKDLNLEFKITECRKLNDNTYLYKNKERKFRNK